MYQRFRSFLWNLINSWNLLILRTSNHWNRISEPDFIHVDAPRFILGGFSNYFLIFYSFLLCTNFLDHCKMKFELTMFSSFRLRPELSKNTSLNVSMLAQNAPKTPSKQPKTRPTRPQDTPVRPNTAPRQPKTHPRQPKNRFSTICDRFLTGFETMFNGSSMSLAHPFNYTLIFLKPPTCPSHVFQKRRNEIHRSIDGPQTHKSTTPNSPQDTRRRSQDGPRQLQDGPDAPKTPSRQPKTPLTRPQDIPMRPKTAPRQPWRRSMEFMYG